MAGGPDGAHLTVFRSQGAAGISRQAEGLGKLCLYELGRRRGAGGLCLYGFRKQATLETLLAQPREKNSFLLSHVHVCMVCTVTTLTLSPSLPSSLTNASR